MERVIGIDLGTTNSCVAVMEGGQPVVLENKGGYKTTPSMVAVSESGKRLVGQIAKRQAVTNAQNTVYAAKRLIGRRWDSEPVRTMCESMPFTIARGPNDDARVQLRERIYSVPELSSIILQEMRMVAEDYLGESVQKAVITVPAHFNDAQRQATKDAGRIAGLDVVRIINEPTAAALAYGVGREVNRTIAIYDLGGGTFDISILDIANGVFEVLATAGDTFLGGEDFDGRIIMDWLVLDFAQAHQIDLRGDRMALQRLRDAAEKAKVELSNTQSSEIHLPFIISTPDGQPLHLQQTLTRAKLEELTHDLVERTLKICQETIDKAGQAIDDVLLVGGMTRMPLVREKVKAFFGKEPLHGVHPDEAVALGAAVQGAALVEGQQSVLLLDVTPLSLGIMIAGGLFSVLIPANTTVPVSRTHTFTTVRDNQSSVRIMVLQGEAREARENELLGEFVLTDIRPAPKGEVEIDVTFNINADGIVSVSAKNLETGQEQAITVTATSGLTDEELARMMKEHEDHVVDVRESEHKERLRQEMERSVDEVERLLQRVKGVLSSTEVGQEMLKRTGALLQRVRGIQESTPLETVKTLEENLMRTRDILKGVLQKSGG